MAENTKIQWTDHTFNPWRGCTKVAEGCKFCYADATSKRNPKTLGIWGDNGTRVVASQAMWREPVKWNKAAAEMGERPRVFCASLGDVFEDWQGRMVNSKGRTYLRSYGDGGKHFAYEGQSVYPGGLDWCDANMNDVRARLFRLIDDTPHLDWLLLTKRPENIRRMWDFTRPIHWDGVKYEGRAYRVGRRKNVWIGTSVATQADADKNIPELLKCRDLSSCLFVSYEPAIEEVDFTQFIYDCWTAIHGGQPKIRQGIWLITGGESGHNARPCDVDWIRSAVRQCKDAGVPCFVKQLGSKSIETLRGVRSPACPSTWLAHAKDPKGGDPSEWPEDLRVREIPAEIEK